MKWMLLPSKQNWLSYSFSLVCFNKGSTKNLLLKKQINKALVTNQHIYHLLLCEVLLKFHIHWKETPFVFLSDIKKSTPLQ